MGSVGMETLPKITMTIAITIAKTGRSIKNRAIEDQPPRLPLTGST